MFGVWVIGTVGVVVAATMFSREGSCSEAILMIFFLLPRLLARRSSLGGARCTPSGLLSYTLSHVMPAFDTLPALLFSSPLKI